MSFFSWLVRRMQRDSGWLGVFDYSRKLSLPTDGEGERGMAVLGTWGVHFITHNAERILRMSWRTMGLLLSISQVQISIPSRQFLKDGRHLATLEVGRFSFAIRRLCLLWRSFLAIFGRVIWATTLIGQSKTNQKSISTGRANAWLKNW